MLEEGRYASICEVAAAVKLDRGYLRRILQLTLLAPDIVEAILDGRLPADLGLPSVLGLVPVEWDRQRAGRLAPPPRASSATGRTALPGTTPEPSGRSPG